MKASSDSLTKQYQLRFGKFVEYRNAVWQILCASFFSRFIPEQSTVLDLGAGWGEFIRNAKAAKKYAMDLNAESGERLPRDVSFLHHDCTSRWPIESEALDVVFTSNFLEHISDKAGVERAVAQAHRCLKAGGAFICLGPNIKYVPGAYWDFWDHHVPITESSISELLKMNGFAIELCIPRFLPYSMSTGSTPPLFLVKLYLMLPFAWPLFGKQFLVVGRKNSPG